MKRVKYRREKPDTPVFSSRRRDTSDVILSETGVDNRTDGVSGNVSDDKLKTIPKTKIDRAHAAMINGGEAELIEFYRTVADSELFVLLEENSTTEPAEPRVQTIDGAQYALVFDLKERVVGLAGEDAPTSQVFGHGLFNLLRGRGIHVAINMGVAPSEMMIPDHAVDWICDLLDETAKDVAAPAVEPAAEALLPVPQNSKFKALLAPHNLPDTFLLVLKGKISRVANLVDKALLLRAEYADRQSGFVIAFSGVDAQNRESVDEAVSEALLEAGRDDLALDIVFLKKDEPSLDRLSRLATHLIPKSPKSKDSETMDLPFVLRKRVDE